MRAGDKLVFIASDDDSGHLLCVKFTRRYSEKAHRCLEEVGHAPHLRAFTTLPGGWKMAVMDYSSYSPLVLTPLKTSAEDIVKAKVEEVVRILHNNHLVHSDI